MGIKPNWSPEATKRFGTWESLHAIVEADLARAGRNGFPCTLQVMNPDDIDGSIEELRQALTAKKGELAGFLIGAGLRGNPDVVFLERALQTVREVLDKDIPIVFNDGPDRHCWAIGRRFGVDMNVE